MLLNKHINSFFELWKDHEIDLIDGRIKSKILLEKLPFHNDFELHGRALLHYFYSWRPRLSLSPSSSSYYKLRAALSGRPTHMVSRESHRGILTIKGLVTQKHGTCCNWGRFCVWVEHRWDPWIRFSTTHFLCQCSSWKSGCMRESRTIMTSWWTTSRWLWVLGMNKCR